MAHRTYRGNLSQPNYPFLVSQQGRTVIIPDIDQTYVVGLNTDGQFDKQKEVPAAYYMENVLPSDEGYRAIGYSEMAAGISVTMRQIVPVVSPLVTDDVGFLGFGDDNNYYTAERIAGGKYLWILRGPYFHALTAYTYVSTAFINGTFYYYIPRFGCFRYDFASNLSVPVTLTGLDPTQVLGICAAFGYLIAFTKDAIAWSSLADPTDFTPNLATGAGGGNVQEAKGTITFIYPIYQGIIIYTNSNIVAGTYTGNVRFPFTLRELIGSSGVADRRLLAISSTGDSHYAYTNAGLQQITLRQATFVSAAFTDFLSGGLIEDYDPVTGVFTTRSTGVPLDKKLAMCGNRYLVMSYGIRTGNVTPNYEYAIVFDLTLKRYGKLKLSHYDMMPYYYYSGIDREVIDVNQFSIALQLPNGTILSVNTQNTASNRNGLIILGKFQMDRNHLMQLISLDFENATPICSVSDLYTLDGKNMILADIPYTQISNGGLLRKLCQITALNHSIVLRGDFDLTSFVMTFWMHGRR